MNSRPFGTLAAVITAAILNACSGGGLRTCEDVARDFVKHAASEKPANEMTWDDILKDRETGNRLRAEAYALGCPE